MFDLNLVSILVVLVVLIISISIHEMMHAYMGHWLGDDTAKMEGRITLNPIKHIDPFMTIILPMITLILFKAPILAAKPVPFNPARVRFEEFGAALVGVIGPFSNFVLAILGAGIFWILGEPGGILGYTLGSFIWINILICIFNMVPIPPLDGSRVLYAFAPETLQRVMASMEQFGIFIVFAFILMVPAFFGVISGITESIFNFLVPGFSGLL